MTYVISSDKHYKALASKIRDKLGNEIKYKPSEMSDAIASMQDIMDTYNNIESGVIYNNRNATIIGNIMWDGMLSASEIDTCEIPESITEISKYAFYYSEIKELVLHEKITTLKEKCFADCDLTTIYLPNSLKSIEWGAFFWTDITSIDIPSNVSIINTATFYFCKYLQTVILRRTSNICFLDDDNAFRSTPIEKGTGYIYVPSALLDSYKTATNWSTYAAQFRALEDYTVDGTTTGEFDYSKI